MKRCPRCNRIESDEALKFCRVDGATLVSASLPITAEGETAQLGSAYDRGPNQLFSIRAVDRRPAIRVRARGRLQGYHSHYRFQMIMIDTNQDSAATKSAQRVARAAWLKGFAISASY